MGETLSKYIYYPIEDEREPLIEAREHVKALLEILPLVRVDMKLREELNMQLHRLDLALGIRYIQIVK